MTFPFNPGFPSTSRSIIKSIQRGTITLSGTTSNTATITAVDTAKAVILYGGSQTTVDSSTLQVARGTGYVVLTNATTVTANKGDSSGTTIVAYEVVEYY